MLYWHYYLMGIILLPGIIIASWAQIKVDSTFKKYNNILATSNITASELIRALVSAAGMNIQVTQTSGRLSDHYDSKKKVIALSNEVYHSSSIAALGVACHEFGHALQDQKHYAPFRLRQILIPITNLMSQLLWPLVIIGLIFSFAIVDGGLIGSIFIWSGIGVFGGSVLVNLVTLPVEYNASNRAIKLLRETSTLTEEELDGAKKTLNAAALTYVAALLVSILYLLRFLLVVIRLRRND